MSRRERLRLAETAWLRRLSAHERRHPVRWIMLVATRIADGWGLAILVPAALLLGGRTTGVAAVAVGSIEAVSLALLVHAVKSVVRRRRPMGLQLERPITAPDKHAFPSGHTAQVFGMVFIAAIVSPAMAVVTFVVGILVGISRMFFGLHYPSDVVVGGLLGLTWSWCTVWACRQTGLLEWLLHVAARA